MAKLIAFIRPDDWEVFDLNEDGDTFSNKKSKKSAPACYHAQYEGETLKHLGFHEVYTSNCLLYTSDAADE